jgi:hypothetical protein
MLRRVPLLRTDVSEERSASFITVKIISELGIMLAVTSNRRSCEELIFCALFDCILLDFRATCFGLGSEINHGSNGNMEECNFILLKTDNLT